MKTAFVFTGCGALGAFQAGAAWGLTIGHGIKPDNVYGVSSGAVNAIAYSFLGATGNVDFWNQLTKFSDAFETNIWNMLFRQGDGILRHGKRMTKWWAEAMDQAMYEAACAMPATVYTLDAATGALCPRKFSPPYTNWDAPDIGMASCAVPGMCQSWRGRVDAGTRVLAPLKDAIDDGADRIFVISGRLVGQDEERKMFWPRAAAAGYYAVDSALTEIMRRDLATAETINQAVFAKAKDLAFDSASILAKFRDGANHRLIDIQLVQPKATIGGPVDFDKCRSFVDLGKTTALNMVIANA